MLVAHCTGRLLGMQPLHLAEGLWASRQLQSLRADQGCMTFWSNELCHPAAHCIMAVCMEE